MLTETRLKPEHNFKVAGFNCYRNDRPSGIGGGVAILIRNEIKHHEVSIPETECLEAVAVSIIVDNKKLLLISAYYPKQGGPFRSDIRKIIASGERVIVAGDFNARHSLWNCDRANQNGNTLLDILGKRDIHVEFPNSHTFYRNGRPSTLDIAICKNFPGMALETLQQLSSDHLPVKFTIGINAEKIDRSYYVFSEADWPGFKEHVNNSLHVNASLFFRNKIQIDAGIKQFTESICDAVAAHTPRRPLDTFKLKLTSEIKELIATKNRLRKRWQKSRDKELKSQVNSLTAAIARQISSLKNHSWSRKLETANTQDNSIWRLSKAVRRKNCNIPPLVTANGDKATTDVEKAEILANNFEKSHGLTKNMKHAETDRYVMQSVENFRELEILEEIPLKDLLIKPYEICQAAHRCKIRKAPGADKIENIVLRYLPQKAQIYLCKILNGCLKIGYFPVAWKSATIFPISKAGKDPTQASSYRPISLLSTLSKIFERLILKRILPTINKTIPNFQFGFRSGHSTAHQLTRVVEFISKKFNIRKDTGMALLDIEKAFDTVWHDGLIYKLLKAETPLPLVRIIDDYLRDRTFTVTIKGENSNPRKVPMGVPQGSILGPHLFSVYIHDVPVPQNCQLALYADDLAIYTCSSSRKIIARRLEFGLQKLRNFYSKWKIKINDSKTETIMFSRRSKAAMPSRIVMNGEAIPWARSVKYLGLHLDSRLNWKRQLENIRQKGLSAISALAPIFRRRSGLSSKNKLLLYKTMIRPLLTYGAPVWSSLSNSSYRKIGVIQNKCLRISVNAHPRISLNQLHFRSERMETIKDFCHRQTFNFYRNLKNNKSTNTCLTDIGKYNLNDLPFRYKHKLPKHILRDEPSEKFNHLRPGDYCCDTCKSPESVGAPTVRFRIRAGGARR